MCGRVKCVQVFSPKSMIFLKEIVVFLQNRPPSAGGRLKCVEICFQNRFLADLSVCRLKCVGTVVSVLGTAIRVAKVW